MYLRILLITIALTGCGVQAKQDALPSTPNISETPKQSKPPEEPETPEYSTPQLVRDFKETLARVRTLEKRLQDKGLLDQSESQVLGILKYNFPKHVTKERKLEIQTEILLELEQHLLEGEKAIEAPPAKLLSKKVGRRTFKYRKGVMELKRATCRNHGVDNMLCKLTFKLSKPFNGLKFEILDEDGAELNFPTVGISRRTKIGVLVKQEILIPQDTSVLTFVDS